MRSFYDGNGKPVTYTKGVSLTGNERASSLSMADLNRITKNCDIVIFKDANGVIDICNGIRATAILAKAQMGTSEKEVLWPNISGQKPRKTIRLVRVSDQNVFQEGMDAMRKTEKDEEVLFCYSPPAKKGQNYTSLSEARISGLIYFIKKLFK